MVNLHGGDADKGRCILGLSEVIDGGDRAKETLFGIMQGGLRGKKVRAGSEV